MSERSNRNDRSRGNHPAGHGYELQHSRQDAKRQRVRETQKKRRHRTKHERQDSKDHFGPYVVLKHHVQFAGERPPILHVVVRRDKLDNGLRKDRAAAKEKERQYRDQDQASNSTGYNSLPIFQSASDSLV